MDPKITAAIDAFREKLYKRSFIPLSKQQAVSAVDTPAKGPVWVSRVKFPAAHLEGLSRAVLGAVKELGNGDEQFDIPHDLDIVGEWVGYRSGVSKAEPEPEICDQQKYDCLMRDVGSEVTILYVHGGALYTGCPATVRPATAALAKLTRGRCFSVDYRLSPQNSFPGALVDVLGAYLSLLYPPPGSYHKAVSSCSIVLAGESSGAYLVLALLLIIQQLRPSQQIQDTGIKASGSKVEVPFPAGVALYAAEGDHTHCLPSYKNNAKLDLLQDPQPCLDDRFPPDAIWPSKPPRGDIFCEISALCHPLVSPAAAASKCWSNMPPMWFAYGQEQLVDDGRIIAKQVLNRGGTVQFAEYEGLPHIFAFLFPAIPQSAHLIGSWADFCLRCVQNPNKIESISIRYEATDRNLIGKKIGRLTDLDGETLRSLMQKKKKQYKVWTGKRGNKVCL